MPGLVIAWLIGEGLVFYRSYKNEGHLPMPGQVLAVSGVYAGLALLAQADQARFLAAALAWGFDIALFLNLAPEILSGATAATKAAQPSQKTPPKGGK